MKLKAMETFKNIVTTEVEFLRISIPMSLLKICQLIIPFLTMVFAGSLGTEVLAGVGLANTSYNLGIFFQKMGYLTVIDAYGPAIYGSGNKNQLSNVIIKTLLQGFVLCTVCTGILLNWSHIFKLIPMHEDGSSEAIISTAILYIRLTAVNGFLDLFLSATKKYFMIQNHGTVVNISSIVLVVVHIIACEILVQKLGFGIYGLAAASVGSRFVDMAIQLTYFFVKRKSLYWVLPDASVFLQWGEMVKLGLFAALSMVAEAMLYEIITILVQFKSLVEIASWVITINVLSIGFACSFGMICSAAILVGIALGERDKTKTKKWIKVSIINAIIQALAFVLIATCFSTKIASLFTENTEVWETFKSTIWIANIITFGDQAASVVCRGVLGAMGRQKIVTIIILIIGYTVTVPCIFGFAFGTSLGLEGLMYGLVTYSALYLVASIILLMRTDVSHEIQSTINRINDEGSNELESYSRLIEQPDASVKRKSIISYLIILLISLVTLGVLAWVSCL